MIMDWCMQGRLVKTFGNCTVVILSDQVLSPNPCTLHPVSLHGPRATCEKLEVAAIAWSIAKKHRNEMFQVLALIMLMSCRDRMKLELNLSLIYSNGDDC
jgi:hypothetical protein